MEELTLGFNTFILRNSKVARTKPPLLGDLREVIGRGRGGFIRSEKRQAHREG